MQEAVTDLMWPHCAGAHHSAKEVCERCSATEEDECRDDAAYEAQKPQATVHVIPMDDPVTSPNLLEAEIDRLRTVLINARLQIEYLHEKFQETASGNAVIARINDVLGD